MKREKEFLTTELGKVNRSIERAQDVVSNADSETSICRFLAIAEYMDMGLKPKLQGLATACRNTAKAERNHASEIDESERESRDYETYINDAEEYEDMASQCEKLCQQLQINLAIVKK